MRNNTQINTQTITNDLFTSYKNLTFIDLLVYLPSVTFLFELVLTRRFNFAFLIIPVIALIYKLATGFRPTLRYFILWFSIIGGAYVAYRSYAIGFLSIILGALTTLILITTYDVVNEEKPQQ